MGAKATGSSWRATFFFSRGSGILKGSQQGKEPDFETDPNFKHHVANVSCFELWGKSKPSDSRGRSERPS